VLWAAPHRVEDVADEFAGHVIMEEVAHRVYEYDPWLLPFFGKIDEIGMERESEAVSIAIGTHGMKPGRHPLGVAMLAALTDFCTASDGVPGHLRPFNTRVRSHGFLP
jgi:hypothetical protein